MNVTLLRVVEETEFPLKGVVAIIHASLSRRQFILIPDNKSFPPIWGILRAVNPTGTKEISREEFVNAVEAFNGEGIKLVTRG